MLDESQNFSSSKLLEGASLCWNLSFSIQNKDHYAHYPFTNTMEVHFCICIEMEATESLEPQEASLWPSCSQTVWNKIICFRENSSSAMEGECDRTTEEKKLAQFLDKRGYSNFIPNRPSDDMLNGDFAGNAPAAIFEELRKTLARPCGYSMNSLMSIAELFRTRVHTFWTVSLCVALSPIPKNAS